MRISVQVLNANGQEFCMAVSASSEVQEVKELIHTLSSIPAEDQKLLHKGKVMMDKKFLKDYNIEDGSTLTLMVKTSSASSTWSSTTHGSSFSSSSSSSSSSTPADASHDSRATHPVHAPLPPVWEELLTFLKRHFTERDAGLVLTEFRKSFELGLSRLSLDDIERLASTKLRQQQQ